MKNLRSGAVSQLVQVIRISAKPGACPVTKLLALQHRCFWRPDRYRSVCVFYVCVEEVDGALYGSDEGA